MKTNIIRKIRAAFVRALFAAGIFSLPISAAAQINPTAVTAAAADLNHTATAGDDENAVVIAAAAGGNHSLYVKSDGTLWAMGSNSYGQLGDGSSMNRKTPVQVDIGVIAVAAGNTHCLFLKSDSTLWAMGQNNSGQLGDGTTTDRNTPQQIATNVIAIAAGGNHSLFLKDDNTLWATGDNYYGQLGNGTTTSRSTPEQIATKVIAIAAGVSHSLFVKSDGTLWAMGNNVDGQLGNPIFGAQRTTPGQVATSVATVAAGYHHSLYLKNDNTLCAMGNNSYGQLGDGTTTTRYAPVHITTNVDTIAAGYYHSLFIKNDGTLFAMGRNNSGQLGIGAYTEPNAPVQVATEVSTIAAGYYHSLFIKNDGTLFAMGQNTLGQLGIGSFTNQTSPAHVYIAPVITTHPANQTVTAGQNATFAITASGVPAPSHQWQNSPDGAIWTDLPDAAPYSGATASTLAITTIPAYLDGSQYRCIATNSEGSATSNAATLVVKSTVVVAVAAGDRYSLHVKSNGSLWATGDNSYGQLGDGTNTDRNTYAPVDTDVIAVAAGSSHSLYVKSDGTLWAMGQNWGGQLGDGTTTNRNTPVQVADDVIAVAAGGGHSMFVKNDGSLWTMGNNFFGQLGTGYNNDRKTPVQVATDVIAVVAGVYHSMFLKSDTSLQTMGSNICGQLGKGTDTDSATPVQVASDVIALAAGSSHSLYVKSDGSLWAMGNNEAGQLGDGTNTNRNTPVQVADDVIAVAAGGNHQVGHSLYVKSDGSLWAMGQNWGGQLGDNTTTDRNMPAQVATDVVAVAAGDGYSLFIKTDGSLWAMGSNYYGVFGDGTNTGQNTPKQIIAGGASFAPAIIKHPTNKTVTSGQTATFTNTAIGDPMPTHQWQSSLDGNTWADITDNISATTATLTLNAVITDMDGIRYRCVVANLEGTTISNPATLVVNLAPAFITHPANGTIVSGASITFTVAATGNPAPTYRWQYSTNGTTWTNLSEFAHYSGTTTDSLTISAATIVMNGMQYRCIVANVVGSATSNAATLTVGPALAAPTITTHPSSQIATSGQNTTFTVAADGNPVPAYQWQSSPNGSAWTDITDATSATLTLTTVTTAMNGMQYRCIVANTEGNITSNPATLTVNPALTGPTITTHPADQTVTSGQTATFTVAASGNPAPAYQWQFSPNGSTWTDVSGATSATLTLTAITTAMDGTRYRCIATNSVNHATSNAAVLTVIPDPAVEAAQQLKTQLESPGAAPITINGPVDFSLVGGVTVASGKTILGENAATITGDVTIPPGVSNIVILGVNFTDGTLVINGASDVEISHCTFTDAPVSIIGGADNIAFSWNKFAATPAAIANGSAMVISDAGASTGILLHHNLWDDGLKSNMPSAANARVAMYNNYFVSSPATGNTTATIAGAGSQILSVRNIYQGVNNPLTKHTGGLLRTLDNFMDLSNTGTTADGTDTVFVPVFSHLMNPAGLDTPALTALITANAGNTNGKNSIVTPAPTPNATASITATVVGPGATSTGTGASVPAISGGFTLTANAAGFVPNPAARQWYRDNFFIPGATAATYVVTSASAALHAGAYAVELTTPDGEIVTSGAFTVRVGELAPPDITTHPAPQVVTVGGSATFYVVATGESLSYQWQKDTVPISGATGASYTIAGAQQTHAGAYRVVVSNPAGDATSNAATLTVNAAPTPPVITSHPSSRIVTVGDNVTFAVVATGSNLAYQWMKNGTNISGATSASYTITNAQQTHAGSYSVRVSNTVDSVTSNTATLTVNTNGGGGSGGGGGGGGAISMPFLALLAMLFALRGASKHSRKKAQGMSCE